MRILPGNCFLNCLPPHRAGHQTRLHARLPAGTSTTILVRFCMDLRHHDEGAKGRYSGGKGILMETIFSR